MAQKRGSAGEANYGFMDVSTSYTSKKSAQYILEVGEFVELRGKKILDFGCGTGELTKSLVKENEVYGIDGDPPSIRRATKNGLKARTWNLNTKLGYKDGIFDVIFAKDIFEHLDNPALAISEIRRVAKKGAIVLMNFPNEFGIDSRINVLLGKGILKNRWFPGAKEWNNPHIRFFTRNGAKDFLRTNNFEIIKDISVTSSYFGFKLAGRLFPGLFCGGIIFIARKKG